MLTGELPRYRLGLPGWAKRRIGAALDRRLPRWASHVIAVSTSIRDQLVPPSVTLRVSEAGESAIEGRAWTTRLTLIVRGVFVAPLAATLIVPEYDPGANPAVLKFTAIVSASPVELPPAGDTLIQSIAPVLVSVIESLSVPAPEFRTV